MSVTIGAAAVFAVVGGYTNDWLGRKPTILLASFVFTTGAVLLGVALNREMLLAGRIIVGMGIGIPNSVPVYRVISKLALHTYLIKHQVRIQGGPRGPGPPLTLGFEAPKLSIFGPYLIFP